MPARSADEPEPLQPIVGRVDRLKGDFHGRLEPKMERILGCLDEVTQEWWRM